MHSAHFLSSQKLYPRVPVLPAVNGRDRPDRVKDGMAPNHASIIAKKRHENIYISALKSPSDGLDTQKLRKYASNFGLPKAELEQLVVFANLLAAQNLLSKNEAFQQKLEAIRDDQRQAEIRHDQSETRYGQAEARYGQAEARYGQAEARRAQALDRAFAAEKNASRLQAIASQRYIKLAELRGSVNLRDELREILNEGADQLVQRRRETKQTRPSVLEKWTYIFNGDVQGDGQIFEGDQKPKGLHEDLMSCCRAVDGRLGSAEKAASTMVRIIENLDLKVHRNLPPEVIRRIGGIAIEESALLGMQDCKFIECVMTWAAKPCRIVSQEEVDALVEQETDRSTLT